MTTITYFTSEYPPIAPGGVGNTARFLTERLLETDFKVNIITLKHTKWSSLPSLEKQKNLTIYRLQTPKFVEKYYKPALYFPFHAAEFSLVQRKILKDTDLIHALHFRDVAFIKKGSTPMLSHASDYYPAIVPLNPLKYPFDEKGKLAKYFNFQFLKMQDILSLHRSDLFFTGCRYTQQILSKTYHLEKKPSKVVYKGINPDEFSPLPYQKRDIDILFIGSRFEVKGAKELIYALAKLKPKFPNLKCVMIGRYSKIDLDYPSLIKELGLEKNIEIIGYIDHDQIFDYYNRSKVYVLPVYVEAFAQSVLEAMAAKIPVITTNVGGLPEAVTPDVGFLIEPRSSEQLAEKMLYLLENPQQAEEMGENGRQRVEKHFRHERMIEEYIKTYDQFLTV